MHRRAIRRVREEQADHQISRSGNTERDGVADQHRVGRKRNVRASAECQDVIGSRIDPGCSRVQRDMRRSNLDRAIAEYIRNPHPHGIAADRRMDNLTERLIVEYQVSVIQLRGVRVGLRDGG